MYLTYITPKCKTQYVVSKEGGVNFKVVFLEMAKNKIQVSEKKATIFLL